MTELPRRIVNGGAGDWARSVIRSARLDVPSPRLKRDLLRNIAAAGGAAGVATATASAKALGGLVLKWLTLGVAVGVLSVGTAFYLRRAAPRRASVPGNATAMHSMPNAGVPAEVSARSPLPSLQASSVATLAVPPAAASIAEPHARPSPPPASAMNRESPASQSQISEEIAAIKSARDALASHDATGALSALDRYRRTYPAGLFGVEAQVLRIDALLELGQYAAARELAQRFLAAQPDSPYARHVRSVASAATRTNP